MHTQFFHYPACRFCGRHLLLTMTRDDIQLWTWADPEPPLLEHMGQPDLYIPLKVANVSAADP